PLLVTLGEDLHDRRCLIPAGGEDRPTKLASPGDAGEGLVLNDGPVAAIPLGQAALRLLARPVGLVIFIGADHQPAKLTVAVLKVDVSLALRAEDILQVENLPA